MDCEIETRAGTYKIVEKNGAYWISLNGVDKHGVCSANDVISWLSNALHNAEYVLISKMDDLK